MSEAELKQQQIARRLLFVDELRRLRQVAGLTQPAMVEAVGEGLSLNAYKKYEWRGGSQIPSEDRLRRFVEVFGHEAAADLVLRHREADHAREMVKSASASGRLIGQLERIQPWDGYTFRELLERSVESVVANCETLEQTAGRVTGWRHFLEDERLPITSMSSSYGLRVLLLADHAGSSPSIGDIRESILQMEESGGGWSARTQIYHHARAEAYGPILYTLRLAGLPDNEFEKRVAHYENVMDRSEDPATWQHTTVLTSACRTLSKIHPESRRIGELLETLAEAAVETDEGVYWTQELPPDRAQELHGSAAHTARAVSCIAEAPESTAHELRGLVEKAVRWLESRETYDDDRENIERVTNGELEFLHMRHFTASWVAMALAKAAKWVEPSRDALIRAEDTILSAVSDDGLWRWQSGEIPIWMTYQGLRGLRYVIEAQHDLTRSSGEVMEA